MENNHLENKNFIQKNKKLITAALFILLAIFIIIIISLSSITKKG